MQSCSVMLIHAQLSTLIIRPTPRQYWEENWIKPFGNQKVRVTSCQTSRHFASFWSAYPLSFLKPNILQKNQVGWACVTWCHLFLNRSQKGQGTYVNQPLRWRNWTPSDTTACGCWKVRRTRGDWGRNGCWAAPSQCRFRIVWFPRVKVLVTHRWG